MSKHRTSKRRSRKVKVIGVITGVVIALLVSGVALSAFGGKFGHDQVAPVAMTGIERLAPLNTSQMVVTDGVGPSSEWWRTVTSFMPSIVQLGNLTPTADLGITHLGYSFSEADPGLGLDQRYVRMVYVETGDAVHASKVERWLATGTGAAAGAFSTAVVGNIVVLATSDVPLLSQLTQGQGGLGSTSRYQQDTAGREPGSLIWEDWGAYVKAAGASNGKPAEYASFFYGATGFTQGSRWVGYSTSPQAGWSGRFVFGGLNPKLVSVDKVDKAIMAYIKVLAKDAEGIPVAADLGTMNYLRDGFYVRHAGLSAATGTMGLKDLAFTPEAAGDTLFSFKPMDWLAGTSKTASAQPEGIALFAYSIKGDRINLKVTPSAVAPAVIPGSPTPARVIAPPVGATPLPYRSAPDGNSAGL